MTRSLDALVAEKLFLWRWMRYQAPNMSRPVLLTALFPPDAPNRICAPNEYWRVWEPSDATQPRFSAWDCVPWWEDGVIQNGIPCYSTDIAFAWRVVEKMRKVTDAFVVAWVDEKWGWMCDFSNIVVDTAPIYAKRAPLAICIAALRAVGVSQDKIDAAMEANE